MPASEWISIATAATAVLIAIAAVVRDRKTPVLTQAQADGVRIDAEAVKAEVKRANTALNVGRDLRILDLEKWADRMRPTIYRIKERDDVMCTLIKSAYAHMEMPIPDIPPFPEVPEFPPPRSP